jgi:site-specific recombinase XerD
MRLDITLTEFAYSKDWSPASRAWYSCRLGAFTKWCTEQDITDIEDLTAPLVRRYLDYRRTATCKTGKPLDSHTLHGHARAIRALLNWAVREELLRESTVKRSGMPKREQKVIPTLSQRQIDSFFAACDQGETAEYAARDRAILALLLDTGMRAGELCGLTLDTVYFTPDDAHCLLYGKGRKQREVGLGRKSRQLLHKYVYRYRQAPKEMQHVFVA